MHLPTSQGSNGQSLDAMLQGVAIDVARVLGKALDGGELTVDETVLLFRTTGAELEATAKSADELRHRAVGDLVTYVVNRNINFTNVCIKRCGFCAFSRDFRLDEGYLLPTEEILRRAKEAWDLGATEVCIQAGLPPQMEGDLYIKLTRALKEALPELHIHGFSPEEVLYGAVRSRASIREYLRELKEAGVGSLPGTSAEILDQDVRDLIAPGRIRVDQWIEVITTAHELGIPTTSTIMYGHVEDEGAQGTSSRSDPRPSEDKWRFHRVRPPEFRSHGSAHVQARHRTRGKVRSLPRGSDQDARGGPDRAEQLDTEFASLMGQRGTAH